MKHKSNIALVAFGKTPKRIRREKIENALQELKGLGKSIDEAKEIVKRQNRRERVVIDNTTAIRELVIELNKEYGIR